MHPLLPLTLDELLTTTRAVRKRLDLSRPVEREVLLECLAIAQQAPTASNMQNWHFVVVTDPDKRAALAEIYRKGWDLYLTYMDPPALSRAFAWTNTHRNRCRHISDLCVKGILPFGP